MNSARWDQIKNILADAVECPSDRASFVVDSCGGDRVLQEEVETLLAQDDSSWCDDAFLLRLRAALLHVAVDDLGSSFPVKRALRGEAADDIFANS